jgi:hypothetical protein
VVVAVVVVGVVVLEVVVVVVVVVVGVVAVVVVEAVVVVVVVGAVVVVAVVVVGRGFPQKRIYWISPSNPALEKTPDEVAGMKSNWVSEDCFLTRI